MPKKLKKKQQHKIVANQVPAISKLIEPKLFDILDEVGLDIVLRTIYEWVIAQSICTGVKSQAYISILKDNLRKTLIDYKGRYILNAGLKLEDLVQLEPKS